MIIITSLTYQILLVHFNQILINNPIQYNMEFQILQYINNHGPPHRFSFKSYPLFRMNPDKKQDALKVDIKT